jgi:hypothetical protein
MSDLAPIGRALISVGAVIVVIGVVVLLAEKLPYVGRLPGDLIWKKGSFQFYFPLATCLIVSLLVSLVLWLARK